MGLLSPEILPTPPPLQGPPRVPPRLTRNLTPDFIFFRISRLVRWLAPEDSREGVEAGRLKGVDC